jgi:hypothetical protein
MELRTYEPILQLPKEGKVQEVEIAYFWLNDGVLFTVVKTERRSLQNISDLLSQMKQLLCGSRVFFLVDLTLSRTYSQTEKNLIKTELFPFVKAIAILSASPVGKMLGKTIFTKGFHGLLVREFSCVEDAMSWIEELKLKKNGL